MIIITRRFEFCYGHYLPAYPGKCANVHGHNSILEVSWAGDISEQTGMVADFADMKSLVEDAVIQQLDHKLLNDYFENPTAENILNWIVKKLKGRLVEAENFYLCKVRLTETPNCWVEWRGHEVKCQ